MNNDLTLEKLKIHERLVLIETKFDSHTESEENFLKTVEDLIKKHDSAIYGNGKDGLVVKIDRLETEHESRKWHFRTLYAIVAGIIVEMIFKFLR